MDKDKDYLERRKKTKTLKTKDVQNYLINYLVEVSFRLCELAEYAYPELMDDDEPEYIIQARNHAFSKLEQLEHLLAGKVVDYVLVNGIRDNDYGFVVKNIIEDIDSLIDNNPIVYYNGELHVFLEHDKSHHTQEMGALIQSFDENDIFTRCLVNNCLNNSYEMIVFKPIAAAYIREMIKNKRIETIQTQDEFDAYLTFQTLNEFNV